MHNREPTMKRLAPLFGVLAAVPAAVLIFGLATPTPVRADYAVVQFADGYCEIWWDSGATPWGVNWSKLALAPDWPAAEAARAAARYDGTCH
jgi:hypothetical protein